MQKGTRTAARQRRKHPLSPDNPHHPQSTMAVPRLLTCVQFAHALGISQSSMRRKMRLREVTVVKVGARSVRIPASEVQRLMEQNMTPALV